MPEADESARGRDEWAAGVKLGAVAALAVTVALAAEGARETGDPWGPLNDVSHIVVGEERSDVRGFDPVTTPLGVLLNAAAITGWSVLYRRLFGRPAFPRSVATAAGSVAAYYVIDYCLLPQRLAPGFERRLSRESVAAIYGVLALTFLLANGRIE